DRQPVHSPEPTLPVLRVRGDRPRDRLLPRDARAPAGLAGELLVADPQGGDLARPRAVALGGGGELPARPVTLRFADAQDQRSPVGDRDVLAMAVAVDVAGDPRRGHREMAPHSVRAVAEVAHRLEIPELDDRSLERLPDDRAGHGAG